MPPGRPQVYTNIKDIEKVIEDYFNSCKGPLIDKEGNVLKDGNGQPIMVYIKPVTVTGLCLSLGFTSRQTLLNYQNRPDLMDAIIRAKLMCQDYAETRLYDKDGVNGAKFSLVNNFGWVDRQEIETNSSIEITLLSSDERSDRIRQLLSKAIDTSYIAVNDTLELPETTSSSILESVEFEQDNERDTL